ncbi:MAG: SecDF P1 head subdomain-containing protein [Bacteroidia bacterium]
MKKIFPLLLITLMSSCSHPDFTKDGGNRIALEANVGEFIKRYINSGDTLAHATIYKTYQEYYQSDKPFLELYLSDLEKADPDNHVGKHFNAAGINPTSSAPECKAVLEKKLAELMDNSIPILEKRIEAFGVYGPAVRKGDRPERLIVEMPGRNDMKRVRKLLQSSAKLEFWETYDNQEIFQKLSDLNAALSKELYPDYKKDTLADDHKASDKPGTLDEQLADQKKAEDEMKERMMKENPFFAVIQPAVRLKYNESHEVESLSEGPLVGTAKISDTAKVNKCLNSTSAKKIFGRYTKFLWCYKPVSENYYQLIAIRVNRSGLAPVSGNMITNAKVVFDNAYGNSPQISVTMNARAASDWAKLTRENIGKSIAIVIDDQVYSYPTVQSEISGGVSSITGNFTKAEADDFANVLKAGYLPISMAIVEETLVPPAVPK